MLVPTFDSCEKEYPIICSDLTSLRQVSYELVRTVEQTRHSSDKHEAIYLGLVDTFGDDISRFPVSVFCALDFKREIRIKTERVYYQEGKPQAYPVELARLIPTGNGLTLKINAVQDVGVNPSFLEEFAGKYS